jgi:prepilin-type N-terminal cleavage/methylation domain-containing protein
VEPRRLIPSPLSPTLSPGPGERGLTPGFALLELLVALVLVSLALALSAQILMESSQMLADASAEQTDAPMPLVVARLRGDVRAAGAFEVLPGESGDPPRLILLGHPAGTIRYEQIGRELRRTILGEDGLPRGSAPALHNVTGWACAEVTPRLLLVTVSHRRSKLRPGLLPQLPGRRGPVTEERTESILVAPRGSGLGRSW